MAGTRSVVSKLRERHCQVCKRNWSKFDITEKVVQFLEARPLMFSIFSIILIEKKWLADKRQQP